MDRDRQAALNKVGDRKELIYLLSEASELEHGLCCCYLFAAFSPKRSADEGLDPAELEAVTRWERTISGVAVQEMTHLALASNLLTAVGAASHLRRSNSALAVLPAVAPDVPASARREDTRPLRLHKAPGGS